MGDLPASAFGLPGNKRYPVGVVCPGMGWTSAVGITQMAHRAMMLREYQVCRSPSEKIDPKESVFALTQEI